MRKTRTNCMHAVMAAFATAALTISLIPYTVSPIAAKPIASPPVKAPSAPPTASQTPGRIITFPPKSIGNIFIGDDLLKTLLGKGDFFAQAKGTVKLPKAKIIRFIPSMDFYRDPSCIDKLPPDTFDIVDIKFLSMDTSEESLCDDAVLKLARMTGIRGVNIARSDVSDRGLAGLAPLHNLECIRMFSTESQGKFLWGLQSKQISHIRLSAVVVGDQNFAAINRFPKLHTITFATARITDQGVKAIANNKSLVFVDLRHNLGITDKSIDTFLKMPSLKELNLRGTKVTAKGVLRLKNKGLTGLGIPDEFLPQEKAAIKKAFVGVHILPGGEPARKEVDSDTETIFSPITRQRKI